MFTINNGPFQGVSFGAGQAYYAAAINPTDPPRAGILLAALNQCFQEKFKAEDGWALRIDAKMLPVDMFPIPREGVDSSVAAPSVRFKAVLVNPNGVVAATASTVWIMSGATEWERGETNARLRLYDAIGLQTRFDIPEGVELARPATEGGTAKVVKLIPGKTREPVVSYSPVTDQAAAPAKAAAEAESEPTATGDNPLDDSAHVATEAAASESTPETTVASAEVAEAPVATVVPVKGGKAKRERLGDNDPAPQTLIDHCKKVAGLRGREVPSTLTTKGEVNGFLRELMG